MPIQSKQTEPLFLDPVKVGAWIAAGIMLFVAFLLWAYPRYTRYLAVEDAKTAVEVQRILKGK